MLNISDCIKKLDKDGYYSSNKILTKKDLNALRKLVQINLKRNNNSYFFLADKKLNKTYINNKIFTKKFENLFDKLSTNLKLKNYKKQKIYKVLRVIAGNRSKKESYRYHFDAHLFTVLIPIFIPKNKTKNNGDLIIYPNFRKLTNILIINIIQKLLFQNRVAKFLLKNKIIFNNKEKILKLKPGNIYIFYGYRTLHGNKDIDPKQVRATLLLHFYDIFNESNLVKLNRNLRLKNEEKIIKNNKK